MSMGGLISGCRAFFLGLPCGGGTWQEMLRVGGGGTSGQLCPPHSTPFRSWLRAFSAPRLQDWSRLTLSNSLSCFLQGFSLVKGKWPQASSRASVKSRGQGSKLLEKYCGPPGVKPAVTPPLGEGRPGWGVARERNSAGQLCPAFPPQPQSRSPRHCERK